MRDATNGPTDWAMIRKTYGKWMLAASPESGPRAQAVFAPEESCHSGGNRGLNRAMT